MDRYDTFLAKIDSIDRFNHGAMKLANEEMALTGLFNGFLRYLLDEWVEGDPISPEAAPEMARMIIRRMTFGLRQPSLERLVELAEGPDAQAIPLLAVRWLMRNASIRVVMPYLGKEWREFVTHYQHVIAALDPDLFNFKDL